MRFEVPFCDRPGQSAAVGVLAGVAGGFGLAAGLESPGVAAVAAALAVVGDPTDCGATTSSARLSVRSPAVRPSPTAAVSTERGGAEPDRSRVARPSHSGPCGPSLKLL
jgi:hypothetical protein